MKFSIIIPVYNSEKYLETCLQSIMDQTFLDFEVICINDGSKDESEKKILEYCKKDSRFRYYFHDNKGVSFSRNKGINLAKGDYLIFLDSDDWLHKRALEKISLAINEEVDCILCSFIEVYRDKEVRNQQLDKIIGKFGERSFSLEDAGLDLIYVFGAMGQKITRRKFLIEKEIKFNEELSNTEDLCVSLEVLAKSNKIKALNYALYYYRRPLDGSTLTTSHLSLAEKSLNYAIEHLKDYYTEDQIIDRFLNAMIYAYERKDYVKDKESKRIFQNILKRIEPSKDSFRNYNRLKRLVKKNASILELGKSIFSITGKRKNRTINFLQKSYSINEIKFKLRNFKINKNYSNNLSRIREKNCNGEIVNVCFLFNEFSKIKTQSLIKEFQADERFNVLVAITTLAGIPYHTQQRTVLENIESYFNRKGIEVIICYNKENGRPLPLPKTIDILFYQQPWQIHGVHSVKQVSETSLTFYVPYFVPNYGDLMMDCMGFHKNLFRYYVLNDDFYEMYYKEMAPYNRNLKVVGHTVLDYFLEKPRQNGNNLVIYAPHWSIGEHSEKYSTFLWSGYFMLAYAKKHPELQWIFKPHPTLKRQLLNRCMLSIEEIQDYWREWESVGKVVEGTEYQTLFNNSKCLITDCGSFLVEYFPTARPLIKLTSNISKQPCDALKKILKHYYNVDNQRELAETLDAVLIEKKDPKRYERTQASQEFLRSNGIMETSASRILQDIKEILRIK